MALDYSRIEADLAGVEAALARLDAGTYFTDEASGQVSDEVSGQVSGEPTHQASLDADARRAATA